MYWVIVKNVYSLGSENDTLCGTEGVLGKSTFLKFWCVVFIDVRNNHKKKFGTDTRYEM